MVWPWHGVKKANPRRELRQQVFFFKNLVLHGLTGFFSKLGKTRYRPVLVGWGRVKKRLVESDKVLLGFSKLGKTRYRPMLIGWDRRSKRLLELDTLLLGFSKLGTDCCSY